MANLKYEVERKLYTELKGKISAPNFQRNFVWKKKARKSLIDSIKQGLPIGSFLLQRRKDGQYNIIDGRQRFSTLLDYESHRYEYIEENDIDGQSILQILLNVPGIKQYYDQYADEPKKTILKNIKNVAVKQLKTKNADESDVKYEIETSITKIFPNLTGADLKKLRKSVDQFYDSVWQILDISNISFPCIIFNADVSDDEIISTFINLNTKGTKLSKYDLYSAKWQNDIVVVDDDSILDKVISKYKDSLENNQNIEVEGFNETKIRADKKINVFEYAYALSKLIGEACDKMYRIKEPSEVDSLGFSILAGILNVPSKNMEGLSKKLVESHLNYIDLKDKIIICAKKIQHALEWYCIAPDDSNYFDHTYNQLVSYIVTYFKAKYEIIGDKICDNNKRSKLSDFEKNLPLWYLYDNIRGEWTGSGDTKLDRLVLIDDIFKSQYFYKVSEESFRVALFNWLNSENNEKNPTVKPASKLFINYIIKRNCAEPHRHMDVEHIIPQKRLDELANREKGVLGISSPANITLIPRFDNRAKREKTYYELIDLKDATALTYDKDLLRKYLYPDYAEIKFIEAQTTFIVEKFNQYKKDRTNTLINNFMNFYYKN